MELPTVNQRQQTQQQPKKPCCTRTVFWAIMIVVLSVVGLGIVVGIPLGVTMTGLSGGAGRYQIEHNEIGVGFLKVVNQYIPGVFSQGIYWLNTETEMIRFTRTVQTMDYNGDRQIYCMSKDGVTMRLDIAIQYQLVPENVTMIAREFSDQAEHSVYLRDVMESTVRQTCSNYTAQDFYNRRGDFSNQVGLDLAIDLKQRKGHAAIILMQLRNVAHPSTYEQANQQKETTIQDANRALVRRQEYLSQAETRLLQAVQQKRIALVNAQAVASSHLVKSTTEAAIEVQKWVERTQGLATIRSQMPTLTDLEFVHYIEFQVLSQLNINTTTTVIV